MTLLFKDVEQRGNTLREESAGLRTVIRSETLWRRTPDDLPPWDAVCQQTPRWLAADCLEALFKDLWAVLRVVAGRKVRRLSTAILDSHTLRSSPQRGAKASCVGAKRVKGSELHLAVDTLGHLLALHATLASTDDRAEVGKQAQAMQASTGQSVDLD